MAFWRANLRVPWAQNQLKQSGILRWYEKIFFYRTCFSFFFSEVCQSHNKWPVLWNQWLLHKIFRWKFQIWMEIIFVQDKSTHRKKDYCHLWVYKKHVSSRSLINFTIRFTVGIISVMLVAIIVFVYSYFKHLRTVHGKSIKFFVMGVLITMTFLPTLTFWSGPLKAFAFISMVIGFTLSNVWMNVLSFDIWWTFKWAFIISIYLHDYLIVINCFFRTETFRKKSLMETIVLSFTAFILSGSLHRFQCWSFWINFILQESLDTASTLL